MDVELSHDRQVCVGPARASVHLQQRRLDTTTKEVGELDHEQEEGAEGKDGRCGQERAEDDK
eukprot:scaffold96341_cov25-Phaeocystis_antarctica.AAC.1